MHVADAGPEHHQGEAGEEHLLDEVRGEEGEDGRGAQQEREKAWSKPADESADGLCHLADGKESEREREDCEEKGRAAEERAVKRGEGVVAGGLLDCGGGVVQRGAMMVVGPVFVAARLQQASRGEGLVCLVRMERACEKR